MTECPETCTDDPAQRCYLDLACLNPATDRYNGLGCNAGGVGERCRFCGFDNYPPCPVAAGMPNAPPYYIGAGLTGGGGTSATGVPIITIIAIAASGLLFVFLLLAAIYCYRRRKKLRSARQKGLPEPDEMPAGGTMARRGTHRRLFGRSRGEKLDFKRGDTFKVCPRILSALGELRHHPLLAALHCVSNRTPSSLLPPSSPLSPLPLASRHTRAPLPLSLALLHLLHPHPRVDIYMLSPSGSRSTSRPR